MNPWIHRSILPDIQGTSMCWRLNGVGNVLTWDTLNCSVKVAFVRNHVKSSGIKIFVENFQHLTESTSKIIQALLEAKEIGASDLIFLVQCKQPKTHLSDLDNMIKSFCNSDTCSIWSVMRPMSEPSDQTGLSLYEIDHCHPNTSSSNNQWKDSEVVTSVSIWRSSQRKLDKTCSNQPVFETLQDRWLNRATKGLATVSKQNQEPQSKIQERDWIRAWTIISLAYMTDCQDCRLFCYKFVCAGNLNIKLISDFQYLM